MKKRIHQIELFMKYPSEVQQEIFQKLIRTAKNTEYGKKYSFNDIDYYHTFRQRVPVCDYNKLKPYIDRLRSGEQNILWPTDVKWYAKSSGTSNDKSKFIPVTQESLEECHFKGGKDMLTMYCHNYPDTKLFTGKSLGLTGSLRPTQNTGNSVDGDLSAILVQNLPLLAEFARTPSAEIALMENWEDKVHKIAEATIPENVTSLAGVPSWMLMLLKYVLKMTGKQSLNEVWPGLEVFFHGGISFAPYENQYMQIMPKGMNYMETYNASEGFFGLQDQLESKDLLLMLDYGVFYEFISSDEWDKENPETMQLHEVEAGMEYAILISTNGGLWRYRLGDTVRFTSLNPYRIKIAGRTKNYINAFGEELMIENAEKALMVACEKTNSVINEYTAAPNFYKDSAKGCHQWFIEFEKEPEDIKYFATLLDNALKSLNSDYEAKRYLDMVMTMPEIYCLPNGTFYNWLKSKNRLGGQFKVPRLSNDRRVADDLINLMNIR